jgi:hypothetical protein
MLDDLYRIRGLFKANGTSDLSNADWIRSGTTRYVRRNSASSKMLVYSETSNNFPYPGVTSLPSGIFRATWMKQRNRNKGLAIHFLQWRWSPLWRSAHR